MGSAVGPKKLVIINAVPNYLTSLCLNFCRGSVLWFIKTCAKHVIKWRKLHIGAIFFK